MAQMSKEEKKNWYDLCDYLHYNILGYTKDMKFPKFLAIRLKGLAEGNFIANKKTAPNASYTFKEILITSKLCSCKIKNYFTDNTTKIKDEKHKINLIMMFIEQEINDVVLRLKKQQSTENEIERLNLENHSANQAEYKSETTDKTLNARGRFDSLW